MGFVIGYYIMAVGVLVAYFAFHFNSYLSSLHGNLPFGLFVVGVLIAAGGYAYGSASSKAKPKT